MLSALLGTPLPHGTKKRLKNEGKLDSLPFVPFGSSLTQAGSGSVEPRPLTE